MKRTLIIGPVNSGKSAAARLLANTSKSESNWSDWLTTEPHPVRFASFDLKTWSANRIANQVWNSLCSLTGNVDILLLENIPAAGLDDLIKYFTCSNINIVPDNGDDFCVQSSELILTCQYKVSDLASLNHASFLHRYLLINCGGKMRPAWHLCSLTQKFFQFKPIYHYSKPCRKTLWYKTSLKITYKYVILIKMHICV